MLANIFLGLRIGKSRWELDLANTVSPEAIRIPICIFFSLFSLRYDKVYYLGERALFSFLYGGIAWRFSLSNTPVELQNSRFWLFGIFPGNSWTTFNPHHKICTRWSFPTDCSTLPVSDAPTCWKIILKVTVYEKAFNKNIVESIK